MTKEDIKKILLANMDEIKYLQQNSEKLKYEDFINDETLKRSFVWALEIIGETAKNLPENFKSKYPKIQWKEMAELRDVLVYCYFSVDYKAIWNVIKNKIPKLKLQIEKILSEVENADEA